MIGRVVAPLPYAALEPCPEPKLLSTGEQKAESGVGRVSSRGCVQQSWRPAGKEQES